MRLGSWSWSVAATSLLVGATLSSAATWTKVGDSAFTVPNTPGGNRPSFDIDRIPFHSVVVDGQGDVYCTAGENRDATTGSVPSGITIFPADNSAPINIDVTPSGLNIPGGIIKLVVGADGHVYGLQNWLEIGNGLSRNDVLGAGAIWYAKILRFRRDTVNPSIGLADVIFHIRDEEVALGLTPPLDSSADGGREIIGGLTTDGPYLYWAMGEKLSNVWKFRFLYRWNTLTGTPGVPERSPLNCSGTCTSANNQAGDGLGYGYMFDIEAVGTDSTLTPTPETWLAIPWSYGSSGQPSWHIDAMTWTRPRSGRTVTNNATTTASEYWWRDYWTATAYDPVRKKLWMSGRSKVPSAGTVWTTVGTAANTNNPIIDATAGGDGSVLQLVQTAGKRHGWNRAIPLSYQTTTFGARFRVLSYSNYTPGNAYLLHTSARAPTTTSQTAPQVALGIDGSNNFALYDIATSASAPTLLATLGPVDTNAYNEIHIYCDGTGSVPAASSVRCWWNGVEQTLVATPSFRLFTTSPGDAVSFGAASNKSLNPASPVYSMTVNYDWVGLSNALVPGQTAPEPTNIWPTQSPSSGGVLWAFLDGRTRPELLNISSTMVRFNGTQGSEALLNGDTPTNGLTGYDTWATNGNPIPLSSASTGDYTNYGLEFKGIDSAQPMSNTTNGGHYWVTSLAVNPCDGTAWYSLGSDDKYETSGVHLHLDSYNYTGTYGKTGRVYTVGPNGTIYTAGGDEGAPLAEGLGRVVGLTFKGRTVYALVNDLSVNPGTFSLYKATNPSPSCCNEVPVDADGDGDVDMTDFGAFQQCYKLGVTAFSYGTWTDSANQQHSCGCFDRAPTSGSPNGYIDDADFTKFMNCASRASLPQTDPTCK